MVMDRFRGFSRGMRKLVHWRTNQVRQDHSGINTFNDINQQHARVLMDRPKSRGKKGQMCWMVVLLAEIQIFDNGLGDSNPNSPRVPRRRQEGRHGPRQGHAPAPRR